MSGADVGRAGPVDPDASGRPPHLRPALVGLVAIGGAAGTGAREALVLLIPDVGGLPLAVLLINVSGAFALGLLLERLVRLGPDGGVRRVLRLGLGTGFCGGFTTYSALAAACAALLDAGATGIAVAYGLGTVVLGAAAAWAGILLGARGGDR